MIVLGLSGGTKRPEDDDVEHEHWHDAAAVLMQDGEILAAIEEERLNRLKHTNCFPVQAIRYCLDSSGVSWNDLDVIAKAAEEKRLLVDAQVNALMDSRLPVPQNATEFMNSVFQREFGADVRQKLRFCDHHDAHLWSAFVPSGFDQALVVSIDGFGDDRSGAICIGSGNVLKTLREYTIPQSLGVLYTNVIRLIGYSEFDEYKAMGLAPCGDPSTFKSLFDAGYRLLPEGSYHVDPLPLWVYRFQQAGLIPKARRRSEPFSQMHKDLAAGLQSTLEEIAMHVIRHFHEQTGLRSLCIAGGVAHNCTLNGKILQSGLFDRVFVQPAAHDAGTALGAAYSTFAGKSSTARPMTHVYLGPQISETDAAREQLNAWSEVISFEFHQDIAAETARLLADDRVVGWVQGRSEFGPRALGNRSILADPRPAENKNRINMMVKKREQFRPFAPAVVEEKAHEFFDIPPTSADLSFMTYVINVKPSQAPRLAAITHVDGTARIQTVSRHTNPRFWNLLNEFGKLTGMPVLLNTSFNNDAEPIVDSIDDAIACFLTTEIEVLVVENYVISKRTHSKPESFLPLTVRLAANVRLVKGTDGERTIHKIESTKAAGPRRPEVELSPQLFSVLLGSQSHITLDELMTAQAACDDETRRGLLHELMLLWAKRLVHVRPCQTARVVLAAA